ncbi:hypothetical protein [Brachyspira hyodysenteriae]|uniref:hypothetical protein n=1 Tax=Brachyspira hyodysenteriae TaxID=159 RepID=UPI0022CD708B|nr:hypothetical protein [Brachyspira hyodysenteriae]MCZ9879377.1 hypothetical protein [Brachyspira hyodysenteriae]MCZ9941230.1 hypothetical protein [Brachyspira hyodysenteriae]
MLKDWAFIIYAFNKFIRFSGYACLYSFLVFSKDVRLGEALPFLMGGLLGLAGFKSYQSKFEGKDNQ